MSDVDDTESAWTDEDDRLLQAEASTAEARRAAFGLAWARFRRVLADAWREGWQRGTRK